MSIIPIYGLPFAGCTPDIDWPGCSIWPETLRGFLMIFPLLVIMKHSKIYITLSILIFTVLSLLGGPVEMLQGEYMNISSIDYFYAFISLGKEFILGGMIAFGLYFLLNASVPWLRKIWA